MSQDPSLSAPELLQAALLESLPDGITVLDAAGQIVLINDRAAALAGAPREALIGQHFGELGFRAAHQGEDHGAMFAALLRGESVAPFRARFEVDGKVRWFELEPVAMRRGDQLLGVLIVSREVTQDIDAHRRVEQERTELLEQLMQAQKMEAVGQLAGGVAHDFNNLLTSINGLAEFVLAELPAGHELRGDIEEIHRAGTRAASLTSQLLAFSRRQVLKVEQVRPTEAVRDMDKMLRRLIGADIELVTLLDEQVGEVLVDPSQLQQVLINLAVNSRDAMPGGGKLTIKVQEISLDGEFVRAQAWGTPGRHVLLEVRDTGVGMDSETLARIFEPFFTTKEMGKGTGLGMSTVHGIVHQSGGHILGESSPGQGSVFRVYLPCTDTDQSAQLEAAETPKALKRGSETICVVEDEPTVRTVIVRILEKYGYAVIEAANGEEALRLLRERDVPVQALLTDLVMPLMGGKELAERARELIPELCVVYMSGYSDSVVLDDQADTRNEAFLQKPFTADVVVGLLRKLLDRS